MTRIVCLKVVHTPEHVHGSGARARLFPSTLFFFVYLRQDLIKYPRLVSTILLPLPPNSGTTGMCHVPSSRSLEGRLFCSFGLCVRAGSQVSLLRPSHGLVAAQTSARFEPCPAL